MKIAVLKEAAGESRCAAVPETVKKFAALGVEVAIEKGAGELASVSDSEFEAAGARIGSRAEVLDGAVIVRKMAGVLDIFDEQQMVREIGAAAERNK